MTAKNQQSRRMWRVEGFECGVVGEIDGVIYEEKMLPAFPRKNEDSSPHSLRVTFRADFAPRRLRCAFIAAAHGVSEYRPIKEKKFGYMEVWNAEIWDHNAGKSIVTTACT